MGGFNPLFGKNAPNNKVVVAVMGLNGRGTNLAQEITNIEGMEIGYLCDVDDEALNKVMEMVVTSETQKRKPKGIKDFREALEDKDLDALVIAAPDHWHTPATLIALEAGKHVYVEKPCGHNPQEGEMLLEAEKKYGKVIQMGNQQRSAPESIQAVQEIRDGIIGRPYFGKAWYANARGSIGKGQAADPAAGLDYDLWQGPAPRQPYQSNLIHYNWHWFKHWGTGEICNNGTHEIDICRWALGVDYPTVVSSQGGRYHYDDDWEFYDTQVTSYDYEDQKSITWEGRSCNGLPVKDRGRGSIIYGTEGSVLIDRNGYEVYDMENQMIKEVVAQSEAATMDTRGGDMMTRTHLDNFRAAIVDDATLNSPIDEGHKSVLLCHLGNIAQEMKQTLSIDQANGHIKDNPEAMNHWGREYAPEWKPDITALGMKN